MTNPRLALIKSKCGELLLTTDETSLKPQGLVNQLRATLGDEKSSENEIIGILKGITEARAKTVTFSAIDSFSRQVTKIIELHTDHAKIPLIPFKLVSAGSATTAIISTLNRNPPAAQPVPAEPAIPKQPDPVQLAHAALEERIAEIKVQIEKYHYVDPKTVDRGDDDMFPLVWKDRNQVNALFQFLLKTIAYQGARVDSNKVTFKESLQLTNIDEKNEVRVARIDILNNLLKQVHRFAEKGSWFEKDNLQQFKDALKDFKGPLERTIHDPDADQKAQIAHEREVYKQAMTNTQIHMFVGFIDQLLNKIPDPAPQNAHTRKY